MTGSALTALTAFANEGLTFDVVDTNPGGTGPIILLHGFPQDGQTWAPVASILADAGHRTLAPTLRGYGERCTPRRVSAYRMTRHMSDVVALADRIGAERVHLVGHDWGGALAWRLAIHHPHRVASLTVLSTPHPVALARALRRPTQLRASWYMLPFQIPGAPRVLARRLGPALVASGLPHADARRYADRFADPTRRNGPLHWYRAMWWTPDTPQGGLDVRVPTTYLWSRGDIALRRAGAVWSGDYVRAPYRFVEIEASHWLPETHPNDVAHHVLQRVMGSA